MKLDFGGICIGLALVGAVYLFATMGSGDDYNQYSDIKITSIAGKELAIEPSRKEPENAEFVSVRLDSKDWPFETALAPRHYGIDVCSAEKTEDDTNLIIRGWVVLETNTENKQVAIGLKTEEEITLFNTELTERGDVFKAFSNEEGIRIQSSLLGFSASIPAKEWPGETYALLLLAKDETFISCVEIGSSADLH